MEPDASKPEGHGSILAFPCPSSFVRVFGNHRVSDNHERVPASARSWTAAALYRFRVVAGPDRQVTPFRGRERHHKDAEAQRKPRLRLTRLLLVFAIRAEILKSSGSGVRRVRLLPVVREEANGRKHSPLLDPTENSPRWWRWKKTGPASPTPTPSWMRSSAPEAASRCGRRAKTK